MSAYRSRAGHSGPGHARLAAGLALLFAVAAAAPVQAVEIVFATELVSMDLTGGPYPMPLASDPANALGDSIDGYGYVDSLVTIILSSQRVGASPGPPSLGETHAFLVNGANGIPGLPPIDPEQLDGQLFLVDSFFDVFFDITVTDVDPRPGRDFAGQPDGAAIALMDNGPSFVIAQQYSAIFDKDAPNFGLFPPSEITPYIGHAQIEIPLGGDINGNGENDKIKFIIGAHGASDTNRTFLTLPDGTVVNEFGMGAFFQGSVVDESTDPPFTLGAGSPDAPAFTGPGALTGPTTATSTLLNPLAPEVVIPEPATMGFLALGLLALRRKRE